MTTAIKYTKKDIKYPHHEELMEYETKIGDMTSAERIGLRKWVADGYSPYENPCLLYSEDGCIMDYITAIRINEDMENNPDEYSWGSNSDDSIPF